MTTGEHVHGGEFFAEFEGVRRAAERADQLGKILVATPPPSTPKVSLPFLPELGEFLEALGQARQRHHAASQRVGSFYQDASAGLGDFQRVVSGQEAAAQSRFDGVGGGVVR